MKVSRQREIERLRHRHADTGNIERVIAQEQGFSIDSTIGSFFLNEPCEPSPAVGMNVTVYRHNGSGIQGIDIDDKPIFFKTDKELEEERLERLRQYEIKKAEEKIQFYKELRNPQSEFNLRWNKLPRVFRQRITRFFRLGEDFWNVAVYELYTCEAAVKIAYACRSQSRAIDFMRSSSDEKKLSVLGEDILNYLSGHQFAFACALAHSYIKKAKSVRTRPGAMQILAGRKTYTG